MLGIFALRAGKPVNIFTLLRRNNVSCISRYFSSSGGIQNIFRALGKKKKCNLRFMKITTGLKKKKKVFSDCLPLEKMVPKNTPSALKTMTSHGLSRPLRDLTRCP